MIGFDQEAICPLVLVRCCGLPLNYIGELTAQALDLGDLAKWQSEYEQLRSKALDLLFSEIHAAPNGIKKLILQLKRDLYNDRLERVARCDFELVSAECRVLLHQLLKLRSDIDASLQKIAHSFVESGERIIRASAERFMCSEAAKALILSSDEITKRWSGEWSVRSGEHHLSQHATTFLKYLSRSSTKPSPFSFFSPLLWAEIGEGTQLYDVVDLGRLRSQAAVNLIYLRASCLEVKRLGQDSEWIWNPTIRVVDGYLEWHLQEQETWRYFKVRAPAAFDAGLINSREAPTFSTSGIRALNDSIRAQAEQSGAIIRLIRSPSKTCAMLTQLSGQSANARSCACVPRSQALVCEFEEGSLSTRPMHRTELWRSFQQSVGSLSTGDRPGKIITEDVLGSSVVQLPKEEIAAITASLSCFCRETEEFASASGLRRALSRAVKVWFPDRRAIPLADLLAKVAAEIGNSNSEDNGFARLWSHLISNFGDASPVLRDRLETVFPLKRVTYDPYTIKISPRTGGEKIPPTGILSGTLQPIRTAYGTQWFLVGVGQGIGKTVKRWLHVDRARGDRLVEWIRKSLESYEGLDVSIQDDVLFNTDLGTNIIPSVLSMPSRIRYFTEGATNVGVSECAVVLDEVSDQVRLTKSYTGENIYTHYESVLSLASRPISTQLLVIFGRPIWSFDFGTVFKHLDSRWKGCPGNAEINRGVEFHPRIVLQPNIILRRACWKVPLQAFPKLSKSLSVSEVARVVSAWRLQFNLPDQVFVRYGSRGDGRGDGYKPQYINFRSIVWVLFLARILENVSETLVIDEALPEIRPEDSNKKRYTEEYAIHWRH